MGCFPVSRSYAAGVQREGEFQKHAAQHIGNTGTSTKRRCSAPRWLLWRADGGKTFPQWRQRRGDGGGGGGRGEEGQTHGRQVDERQKKDKEVCLSRWRIISSLCALTTAETRRAESLTCHKREASAGRCVCGSETHVNVSQLDLTQPENLSWRSVELESPKLDLSLISPLKRGVVLAVCAVNPQKTGNGVYFAPPTFYFFLGDTTSIGQIKIQLRLD